MKIYDFTVRKKDYERMVFTLTLDKKRLSERIVIGEATEVRRCLERGDGEVYYDETRPLGNLLFNFEGDTTGEWNKHGMILPNSYPKFLPINFSRWNEVAPVSEFLTAKYNSGEPFSIFAAIRTWEDYLSCFNMRLATDRLTDRLFTLYKPFRVYCDYKPWQKEVVYALEKDLSDGDLQVELWYPAAKRPFETVAAVSSFMSIISYYTHKIAEWGYHYHVCKVCGRNYLAKNRHYEICSDECRKKQAVESKQYFNEWAKSDKPEQDYEKTYQYWYNQLRKLKNRKSSNPDALAVFKTAFEKFRVEAVERKKAVMRENSTEEKAFADWLFKQQSVADKLMGELI